MSNHTFSARESGFYVAAAIIAYDFDPEPIEDLDIGSLKFYMKTWNIYDEDNGKLTFTEIPTRPCKMSDFGENEDSYFYKASKSWERDLQFHYRKLKCPDIDMIDMFGNYDTEHTANLVITFEKCDRSIPGNTCKDDAEIDLWLREKYLIT